MRTIETTLYQFDKLSDEAKAKALDQCRDWSTDYDWWEYQFENFAERMSKHGYDIDPAKDIHFSGFWSQGDGACFKGTFRFGHDKTATLLPCDLVAKIELLNAKMRLLGWPVPIELEISGGIGTSGRCSHSGTMSVDKLDIYPMPQDFGRCNLGGECDCTPGVPEACDQVEAIVEAIDAAYASVEEAIRDEARSFASDLYSLLQEEYEYLTSDEHIAETIRANEREFTEEGELA